MKAFCKISHYIHSDDDSVLVFKDGNWYDYEIDKDEFRVTGYECDSFKSTKNPNGILCGDKFFKEHFITIEDIREEKLNILCT
jgi:hypothetical protein